MDGTLHPMETTQTETTTITTTVNFVVNNTEIKESRGLPAADIVSDDSSSFILIPLAVLFGILLLSSMVFLMARNRRRLAHIYCKHRINNNFGNSDDDDSDSALEQPNDDCDDPTECLLKGKLQIDNRYASYQTTQATHLFSARGGELLT